MSEERTNMAIRDLKHYVVDNMSLDVQDDFEIICKYIKNLQQKVERLNNIINELENWLNEYYESNRKWYNTELSNNDKQYYGEIYRNTEFMIVKFLQQLKALKDGDKE